MKKYLRQKIHKASSTPDYIKILILRTIGNFLVLTALFTICRTFYQPVREEIRYYVDQLAEKKYIVEEPQTIEVSEPQQTPVVEKITITPTQNKLAELLQMKQIEILKPEDPEFSIVIPKVGANVKVIPNVNPADQKAYLEALKYGVAHASNTKFPGEGGHVFLFAHSTDYWWNVGTYNAVFYLLYKLEKGDEVDIFYKRHRFTYRVIGSEIVKPSQVEYLTRTSNKEFLTLQTCWPPGTTLERLMVFAVPSSIN